MQTITCFSISSNDQLDKVYITLNSLKHHKHPQTNIHYYLLINLDEDKDIKYCVKYFAPLADNNFIITILNISELLQCVDPILGSPYTNIKCFAPKMFKEDKVLVIDTDMVFIKEGIEQLWNTDITNKYAAAVQEPLITYYIKDYELSNVKTKNYFNAGLILFNLKKIREEKLDEDMFSMIYNWDNSILKPLAFEQSLLNFLFKDQVVFLDFKFNNSLLVLTPPVKSAYETFLKQKQNGDTIEESIQKAVILHFLGQNKPWKENVRQICDTSNDFPYKEKCLKIWDQIEQQYKRKEEV